MGPPRPHASAAAHRGGGGGGDDDDDDDDGPVVVGDVMEEEAERMDDELRAALPMSFGQQETKEARAEAVHQKTKRTQAAFGPPRPPPKQLGGGGGDAAGPSGRGAAFGPPRPPARQQQQQGGGGGGGGGGEGGEDDAGAVGPPRPPASSSDDDDGGGGGGGRGSGSEDEEDEEEEDPYHVPASNEVVLTGAERAVTCVGIEHTGSRVAAGGVDNVVRLYDFNGMRSDLRPFREITPHDGHPVYSVSWSPTGDSFLAIYDRDGREKGEFIRGDMYIRDMRNTKGHVSGLTCGVWHPTDRFTAMTASEDGTVRIWDTWNIAQKTVIKPSLAAAGRVAVSTCAYNSDGRMIAAGLMDGTIQIWTVGGKFGRSAAIGAVQPPSAQHIEKQGWSYVSKPSQLARAAHEPQTEITGLAFTQDDFTLASRGTDGTLRLWDLRAFKAPLKTFSGLPANYSTTNVAFSPDERLVLTGTAAPDPRGGGGEGGGGAVVFVDRRELKVVRALGMPAHAAAVAWHDRINQIFVGVGDRKSGGTHVLYDPSLSERGALLPVARAPRAASALDFVPLMIKTPHALPMFRDEDHGAHGRKRGRGPEHAERSKALRPDMGPAGGAGRQGRIGTTGGTLLTQHLLRRGGGLVGVEEELDPRESILRHAGKEDVISHLTAAYEKTQPKPIFAEPSDDEDGDGEGGGE
ncbi:MAG: WD40-repeat-containing domain protein [Monoraphidium minutum]|nr:MAG: WD40-repeat-containing domain protein [Monoraphidium minutum]